MSEIQNKHYYQDQYSMTNIRYEKSLIIMNMHVIIIEIWF
jgi:hypothetical protein